MANVSMPIHFSQPKIANGGKRTNARFAIVACDSGYTYSDDVIYSRGHYSNNLSDTPGKQNVISFTYTCDYLCCLAQEAPVTPGYNF
jgi:hypothetical protein